MPAAKLTAMERALSLFIKDEWCDDHPHRVREYRYSCPECIAAEISAAVEEAVAEERCFTCRHWRGDSFASLPPEHRQGTCAVLKATLDITLCLGWDGGYVEQIDVPGDFGCIKYEAKP